MKVTFYLISFCLNCEGTVSLDSIQFEFIVRNERNKKSENRQQ